MTCETCQTLAYAGKHKPLCICLTMLSSKHAKFMYLIWLRLKLTQTPPDPLHCKVSAYIFIIWLCLSLQYCKDCSLRKMKGWVTKYSSKGGLQVDFISLSQDLQTEIKELFLLQAPLSSTLLHHFQTICHSWSHAAWKTINTLLFFCLSILGLSIQGLLHEDGLAVPSNNKVM